MSDTHVVTAQDLTERGAKPDIGWAKRKNTASG
jgi:hypothetical protein